MLLEPALAQLAALCALFRCSQVFVGLVFMWRRRRATLRWHPSMAVAFPEPFLLAIGAARLVHAGASGGGGAGAARAMGGAALAALGVALFVWALRSYRGVGTGHYVDPDHRLCTRGAYRIVRHPLYLAALLEWFGLGLAFGDLATLLAAALYVAPAYVYYARSEESLLVAVFGEAYLGYRRRVPMLLPRLRRS